MARLPGENQIELRGWLALLNDVETFGKPLDIHIVAGIAQHCSFLGKEQERVRKINRAVKLLLDLHQPFHELFRKQAPAAGKVAVVEPSRGVERQALFKLFGKLRGVARQMESRGGQFADSDMVGMAVGPIRAEGDDNILLHSRLNDLYLHDVCRAGVAARRSSSDDHHVALFYQSMLLRRPDRTRDRFIGVVGAPGEQWANPPIEGQLTLNHRAGRNGDYGAARAISGDDPGGVT